MKLKDVSTKSVDVLRAWFQETQIQKSFMGQLKKQDHQLILRHYCYFLGLIADMLCKHHSSSWNKHGRNNKTSGIYFRIIQAGHRLQGEG